MKPSWPERSRGFWIWGFVFVFLLLDFAIFRYGDRHKNEAPWQRPPPFLYVGGDAAVDARLAELTASRDPTLFALPHPSSFSGGAWVRFQPAEPNLTNWSAPPEWLPLPSDQLGHTLQDYVATNRPSEAPLLAALRAPKPLELRLPVEPIVTHTTVRIEGPLASRKLLSAPPFPSTTHSDVLRGTVVVVAVNGEGTVESAALVESASLTASAGPLPADELAVDLARGFRFVPLALRNARAREAAPSTIGRMVFTWQVLPPTNGVSAAAGAP